MENIEQRVKKIVAEQLGVNEAEVKNESSFQEDLGADSLDIVELVMALEEAFGTEIPDEEAENITTVQQAIDFLTAAELIFLCRNAVTSAKRTRWLCRGFYYGCHTKEKKKDSHNWFGYGIAFGQYGY